MSGFIEGTARGQTALFPDRLEDWIGEDHLVRVVDLFVDELDLPALGFARSAPARTGRPGYHPAVLLKLFIYGYLNRIPSSRRLEREAGRNVELMWLTGRLVPDHKTIADFRRDNGPCIRPIRGVEPPDRRAERRLRCHRREQVPGRQQPGPQLHQGQDRQPHCPPGGGRRAHHRGDGAGRSTGGGRGSGREGRASGQALRACPAAYLTCPPECPSL